MTQTKDRSPLVITATPNMSWLHPEIPFPASPSDMAEEAKRCEEAGASIVHLHSTKEWGALIAAVRSSSALLVQCGMSSLALEERHEIFEQGADMISVIVNHHDEAFPGGDTNVLHPKEELLQYCEESMRSGVRPEFEVWHTGSIWNLRWLLEHTEVARPAICTLFFGWPGGTWSPPSVEEYVSRRRAMPADAVITVSVMGPQRFGVLAAAIEAGDHVRVGTEDYPFDRWGEPARASKLVEEVAALSDALGRRVASPSEAAGLLGIETGNRAK